MSALQEYTCPCCGGNVQFNAQAQKLKCPYCDTEFDVEALQELEQSAKEDGNDQMDWENEAQSWQEGETDGMRVYICNTCGGEIVADENTAASNCPYCDNPVVMKGQFKGDLKPDYVIPFKLEKQAAIEAFKKHLVGKKFLPEVFRTENHIEEIKGLYVPFWLFDTDADGMVRYRATTSKSWRSGNYEYTETSYYAVIRAGKLRFEKVAVDGSSKMPDDLMESLEPYDLSGIVPFTTGYLMGYLADKYDVLSDKCIDRANERVRTSVDEAFRDTVSGYNTVTAEGSNIQLHNAKAKYAMYPVWVLTTRWNDQNFIFAMNGQTGKFVGNLPCDKSLYWKMFFKIFGITAAAISALAYLIWFIR